MRSRTGVAVVAVAALIASCSSASQCSGDVGPETLHVDASAFVDEGSNILVCIVQQESRAEYCGEEGTPWVSLTATSDYPVAWDYYVSLREGNSFVFPERGGGTHHMKCEATTTNIVLPNE